jgi:hypothetical protein
VAISERREPVFDVHPNDRATLGNAHADIRPARNASRVTRVVSGAQMLSALLAVPLGLASGYSIYRANFSPETTCQNLRGSIIAMLDKKIDAAMRHALVRRDVEEFERTCGSVDPDATAAFKRLLAVDQIKNVPAADPVQRKTQVEDTKRAEAKPAPKAEAHVAPSKVLPLKAKPNSRAQEPAHPAARGAEPQRAEAARHKAMPVEPSQADAAPVSDVAWLSAVRDALVKKNGESEARAVERGEPPHALVPPPPSPASPPAPETAPALPQPRVVAEPPPPPPPSPAAAPQQPAGDHPVPPAPVVAPPPSDDVVPAKRGAVGAFIADIPLLGPMVDAVRGR